MRMLLASLLVGSMQMRPRAEQKSVFDNQIKSAAPPNPAGLVPGADDLMPTDNNKRNNICNNNKRRSVLRHYCARSEPVISLRCLSVSLAGSQWTGINLICILNRQREGAIPSFHSQKHEMKVLLPHLHTSPFSPRGNKRRIFFFFHLAAGFDCCWISRVIRCEADCVSRAGSASFTDGRDQWPPGRVLLNGGADEAAVSLLNLGHKAR